MATKECEEFLIVGGEAARLHSSNQRNSGSALVQRYKPISSKIESSESKVLSGIPALGPTLSQCYSGIRAVFYRVGNGGLRVLSQE